MRTTFKLIVALFLMSVWLTSSAAEQGVMLNGRVKDAIFGIDLTKSIVRIYDHSGTLVDSCRADQGMSLNKDHNLDTIATFHLYVPRREATYTIDVDCPGYLSKSITYKLDKVNKYEKYRDIPVIFLERAPHKLGEVTVTGSKIKFFHKGDTLVYNASAFQLSEGSMLDGLISQLPGVELNDDGQIKVNGEFVETLLLNGKKFFDGNNQLMLENIAAYTVKSIEVYKGQTREEKWANDTTVEKHLTMDVKLKKEFMGGIILNAQAGYGTDDRYNGRLFLSRFTPQLDLTFIGNVNNLNDSRKPGKSDTWTPEMMPSGTKEYQMAALNYDYKSKDDRKASNGHITFERTENNNITTTNRTNFLTGGNTYENSFNHRKARNIRIETQEYGSINNDVYYLWGMFKGIYSRNDNRNSALSASFREEQANITREAIEALYSDSSPERLDAVINRSITRSNTNNHTGDVQFYPEFRWKVPGTNNDMLRFELGVKYRDQKEEVWRDYNINYGSEPVPAVNRRQYFDNSPNRRLTLDGYLIYASRSLGVPGLAFDMEYGFRFENTDKDSYMYALDQLADMGIYGSLPEGYLASFDPSNSYTSRLIQTKHSIIPNINYNRATPSSLLIVRLRPDITFEHSHFNYWRDGRDYLVRRSSREITTKNMNAAVILMTSPEYLDVRSRRYAHTFQYQMLITTRTPDMLHLVDVVNDSDPLNISVGNPDLRNEYKFEHRLSWVFNPHSKHISNTLQFNLSNTSNALVRGYTYNTTTGVRHNRTYNTDGNSSYSANNIFSSQFGGQEQFTLSSVTSGSIMKYADMIGVNLEEPVKSKVNTSVATETLKLIWEFGKQQLTLSGSATLRHTSSTREDFNVIDARHFNYGILGNFKLPAGFGINTDFMFYTRRGYGVRTLDTTDAIWNVRLTYAPNRSWLFMVDGFDLLHQLSNVNYAVSASGRTVSYSNALPRYVLFSVQYKFNLQPKKKIIPASSDKILYL